MGLLREPLVLFLALGGALFWFFGRGVQAGHETLVVSPAAVDGLVDGWVRTWRRPPTTEELRTMIREHIREEVLVREARALGLDRDDQAVRRRLRTKVDALAEGFADTAEPSEAELRAWYATQDARYRLAPRLSFQQLYVSEDARGAAAQDEAERLRDELARAPDVEVEGRGDRLSLPSAFEDVEAGDVMGLFGQGFADELLALEPGTWSGPVRSGYGLHVVRVLARVEGRTPELAEVRAKVRQDWLLERRAAARDAFYLERLEGYEVVVEWPQWARADEGSRP